MMTTILIYAFTIIVMVTLAIVFSLGRGASFIAGFNTLPEEEKVKYDVVALCKFMGKMMFALTCCVVLWLIGQIYDMNWLFYVGLALFIALIIFIIVFVNTLSRFKKS